MLSHFLSTHDTSSNNYYLVFIIFANNYTNVQDDYTHSQIPISILLADGIAFHKCTKQQGKRPHDTHPTDHCQRRLVA